MKKSIFKTILILFVYVLLIVMLVSCSVLDSVFGNSSDGQTSNNDNNHTHDFVQKSDDTKHYMECNCGEKINTADHTMIWVIDFEPSYNTPGYKHEECDVCGYTTKENTVIDAYTEDNYIDCTIALDEKLISSLLDYLFDFYTDYDIPGYVLGEQIELCKSNEYNPVLVKFGEERYFAVAYFNPSHDGGEDFCCCNEYTWVGFKNIDKLPEMWNGERFVAAFQINPADLSVNLKNSDSETYIEHYKFFYPSFSHGVAAIPQITFDRHFILLTKSNEKTIYYSSGVAYHESFSIKCVEIEGESYRAQKMKTQYNDGRCYETNLEMFLDPYYDYLESVMIKDMYSEKYDHYTTDYVLFKIDDIKKIISE